MLGLTASGITTVELASANGHSELAFSRNVFLGELPADSSTGALPTAGGPYVVVGYDRAGTEVTRVDLNRVVEAATPPSS